MVKEARLTFFVILVTLQLKTDFSPNSSSLSGTVISSGMKLRIKENCNV